MAKKNPQNVKMMQKKHQKWQKMSENTINIGKKRQKGIGNHQIMAKTIVETCNNDQNSS